MKNTLFILCLVSMHLLQAQSLQPQPGLAQHRQQLGKWLVQQQKPTRELRSGSQRVTGQSTVDVSGSHTDSSKIWYHSTGSSVYDYNTLIYAYNYPYSTTPLFNNCQGIYTQPQVSFKRHDRWTVNPNTLLYGFYQRELAGYDMFGNLTADTTLHADSAMYPNIIYHNTFNAADNIEKGVWLEWSGGTADSIFKQYFEYNLSDQLVKDSLYEWAGGSWHLVAKTFYTYDMPGNVILIKQYSNQTDPTFTAPLIEQLRYVNTYDGSNRLLTVHTSTYDGSALTEYVRDTFAYSGSLNFHTEWREHQYDPINFTWTPQMNMVKHLNTDNLPDTVDIKSFDLLLNQWVPFSRYVMTYNSENNPETQAEYLYDFSGFPAAPDFFTTYYYEDMIITSAGQNETPASAQLYPNPAGQTVHVSFPGEHYNLIQLYDANGRLVKTIDALGQQPVTIDLGEIKKGLYILTAVNEHGIQRFKLVKQ